MFRALKKEFKRIEYTGDSKKRTKKQLKNEKNAIIIALMEEPIIKCGTKQRKAGTVKKCCQEVLVQSLFLCARCLSMSRSERQYVRWEHDTYLIDCTWYLYHTWYYCCMFKRTHSAARHNTAKRRARHGTALCYAALHIYIYKTRNARDRSITHSLQRWVSTKSSISQLECIFVFYNITGLTVAGGAFWSNNVVCTILILIV